MGKEAKVLIGLTVATIVVLVGGSFLFSRPKPQTPTEVKKYDQKLLIGEGSYEKGNKDAKVTLVEFADFQCPACGASAPITQALMTEYGDRVRFVFRHFPLQQHEQAYDAARAAEAAGAQGKFWEMHDKLYTLQDQWSEKSDAMARFEGYAKDLELNIDEFKKSISDKQFDSRIQAGLTDGTAAAVNATPTFYINGQKLSGVFKLDEWKRLIDKELESSK